MDKLLSRIIRFFRLAEVVVRLKYRSNLDKKVKNRILRSFLNLIILNRVNHSGRHADIVGYKLNYINQLSLRFLFREIFLNQEYFFVSQEESPLIIDCGSNIGMSIIYFKLLYPNSKIIGFEPSEAAFACLQANIMDNHLQSVQVNRKAVLDFEGKIDFFHDIENPGSLLMSTVKNRMPKQKTEVDAVRLSGYITEDVDFLKVDVEGAELGILRDLASTGKIKFIKQMVIEYHHHIAGVEDHLSVLLGILEHAGLGYHFRAVIDAPHIHDQFQDILIFAYRRATL